MSGYYIPGTPPDPGSLGAPGGSPYGAGVPGYSGSTGGSGGGMGAFLGPIASVAGAGISSIGGKKAAQAQERSTAQALGFAREQEMAKRQRYAQAMNAWGAGRKALAQMYGLSIPDAAFDYGGPQVPGPVAPPPRAVPRPRNVAALMYGDGSQE